jgi:hypothetical protein
MKARWMSVVGTAVVAVGVGAAQTPPSTVVPAAPAPGAEPGARLPGMIADAPPPGRGAIDFAPSAGPCPAACADGKQPAPFTPFMLGDFVGPVANLFTQFKIAEGESPRPVDRVFFKYNYYNNVDKNRWADPTEPIHNVHLNLYTFGMERTFLDGNASVGLRVPFYTLNGEAKDLRIGPDPATGAIGLIPGGPALDETDFGNIMAIAKLVLWEDRPSGSLLSGGAVVSIPTASNRNLDPGLSRSCTCSRSPASS